MARLKVLDLFAGAGGLSLGLGMVRNKSGEQVFELHRAVEISKYACETLRNHYGSDKVIEGDLTKKSIHKKVIEECKGKVAVVAGGIPCQSFSLIGPRSGHGKMNEKFKEDRRDNLYKEFRDIVKEINPKVIIIENVKGILSKKDKKGKRIIDKIIKDFEEKLGYTLTVGLDGKKYRLLNSADYGVPQKRERVILIGVKGLKKKVSDLFINPTHYNPKLGAKQGLLPYVTLKQAIGDLPEVKPKITFTDLSESEIKKISRRNNLRNNGSERIDLNKKHFRKYVNSLNKSGKQFFSYMRPNGYKFIDHHIARNQQLTDIELFKAMREGETAGEFVSRKPKLAGKLIKYQMSSFMDKYRRQKSDEPSTTIFAHLSKDGNRFIHPWQARTLTPREAARLQSFPDSFIFCGPLSRKFMQIGNAVPPLLAYNIGLAINTLF